MQGAGIRRRRDRQLALWEAWHVAAFYRSKKLPPLGPLLAKMEPQRVMSPQELRAAIIEAAKASGAIVTYLPKKGG